MLWPNVALAFTYYSSNAKRQEQINIHVDAFLSTIFAFAIPIFSFASTIFIIIVANALFVGGFRLLFRVMLLISFTSIAVLQLFPSITLQQEEFNTILSSRIFLLIYLSSFAASVYYLTKRLINLNKKVKKLSITDPLTGCFNRLYFDNHLAKEIQRSNRFKSPLSVIFADLDHFKDVNDQLGHQAGDKVLQQFVQLVNACIRTDIDWVARYGGEEFVIVLPNTGAETGAIAANSIRKSVDKHQFQLGKESIHISCSFGVSEIDFKDQPSDVERLTSNANKALYKAKQKGRNRVEIFNRIN
jgi:diguanylate cyclase (GGDEF)-like protein